MHESPYRTQQEGMVFLNVYVVAMEMCLRNLRF
jgi:hypothetical protein